MGAGKLPKNENYIKIRIKNQHLIWAISLAEPNTWVWEFNLSQARLRLPFPVHAKNGGTFSLTVRRECHALSGGRYKFGLPAVMLPLVTTRIGIGAS
jgi:hypothetical protein